MKTNKNIFLQSMMHRGMVAVPRKHPKDIEHHLQVACVTWFRCTHPSLAHNLFAVPNGGRRNAVTGAKLKAEGVLAGVSDLILLVANSRHGALLIEIKTDKGRQSDKQKEWQKAMENSGYKYVVCRNLEEFEREIDNYLIII